MMACRKHVVYINTWKLYDISVNIALYRVTVWKKKKALGISVQFLQLGECFAFKVRSMFKFSNFRHSS